MNHLRSEDLELYALGRLGAYDQAQHEEHLLVCHRCQERQEEADRFVRAMRRVLAEAPVPVTAGRPAARLPWLRPLRSPHAAMAGVAVLLVAAGVGLIRDGAGSGSGDGPLVVTLQATRGAETVPARRSVPIEVVLDITPVPPAASYTVHVVDVNGKLLIAQTVAREESRLRIRTQEGFARGVYFLRVYDDQGTLWQEFKLEAR